VLILVVSGSVVAALVCMTTFLHRTTSSAATAAESVRLAQAAELDLLLHERNADPLVKRAREADLTKRLSAARETITTEDEARILAEVEARVREFIVAARSDDPELAIRRENAYVALEALVDVNSKQARAATREGATLDRTANMIGLAAALLLMGATGVMLFWLRFGELAPVLALEAQMQKFARGDRSARAREDGPSEFRTLARSFNAMASTIERQRDQQLAFLAGVAHDLRNPLAALKLSNAIISPDQPLPPEDRVRQTFERVQRQVDRLERMVFDLLDAAQIDSGKLDLQMKSCDLREVVHTTNDLFSATSPKHRLLVEMPEVPVVVAGDPVRLEQVLNNLVSNAIKYSPRGGTVRTSISQRNGRVYLSVTDEGIGIDKDDIERIFDPFRRTGASKELASGVGLGLFVARRIVERHGGRIVVTSTPGQGSTFTVDLPAAGGEERSSAAESAAGPAMSPLESYG
jgi:signal transduction histidine kinase